MKNHVARISLSFPLKSLLDVILMSRRLRKVSTNKPIRFDHLLDFVGCTYKFIQDFHSSYSWADYYKVGEIEPSISNSGKAG